MYFLPEKSSFYVFGLVVKLRSILANSAKEADGKLKNFQWLWCEMFTGVLLNVNCFAFDRITLVPNRSIIKLFPMWVFDNNWDIQTNVSKKHTEASIINRNSRTEMQTPCFIFL